MNGNKFIFRKSDKIGVADAKFDKKMLLENFIDTGDYDVIADFERPERFILGRAGVGKTALITRLVDEKANVITIEPESLSLGFISNSTIIHSLSELGVDFSLFYRLLWRHVLGVEILKYHFQIVDYKAQVTILDRLKDKFRRSHKRNNHARALEYLEHWGSSFWQDTDYRIKELTSSVESQLESKIGLKAKAIAAAVAGSSSLTEQQKTEVIHRAQEVVNSVQMKELADLMKMLDDAIDDRQKTYYLVIDRLDENWVDEKVRYKLIKALIETINDFNVVQQVKPMIVLRNDLINRVYDRTRSPGFQEEKYSSLNLHITWTRGQLTEMLDSRIHFLVKQRYTTQKVTHEDILPEKVRGAKAIDYLLDRTLMRPRDLISFFNFCISQAIDSPVISEDMILKAEREYSRDRRAAIRDEWYADYPDLKHWDTILDSLNREFFITDIDLKKIEKLILEYPAADESNRESKLRPLVSTFLEEKIAAEAIRLKLIQTFYTVGYIGVDLLDENEFMWSHQPTKMLHEEEMQETTLFAVHPCFYSCFNTGDAK